MSELEKALANMRYLREASRRFPQKYYRAYRDAKKHYERLLGKQRKDNA